MRLAIDFDGTIVVQDGRDYEDIVTPLRLMPGAREGLAALRRAGHLLLLWSARASLALLDDPALDPFVRAGVARLDRQEWERNHFIHRARRDQMLRFVRDELPGVFHAVDDGRAGKPCVDLFIDDRALKYGAGAGWPQIARAYGDPAPGRLVGSAEGAVPLSARVADLSLRPSGRLAQAIATVLGELRNRGIAFRPSFVLGDGDFWTADLGTSINVPWFLATDALWDLAQATHPWTYRDVVRTLRHEAGHAIGYAFELHRTPGWKIAFGDFSEPYRENFRADPGSPDFVEYLSNVPRHYAQKHPDEDWAETFATWLDPESGWAAAYASRPGALAKLRYVDDVGSTALRGRPTNRKPGLRRPYRTSVEGTVTEALGLKGAQHGR